MKTLCRRVVLFDVATLLLAGSLMAQSVPSGQWHGAIRIMGQELGIRVHFSVRGDSMSGTIDIPVQNAFGLVLRNMRCAPPAISFDLPAGPGLAIFRGEIARDSIGGRFEQSGMAGTFYLRPASPDSTAAQRSTAPLPYQSREVTFTNDTVTLSGTLTMPPGAGPFPAVVMVTGSGPQNRDEEIFDFKPFAIIADHLTRGGVAVLRYDDRGVGKSTGRFAEARTSDFAADAEAGVDFLGRQPGIRKNAIGILGHSEGAIAAAMVAARRQDIGFLLLLGAPAIPGDSVIDFQAVSAARRSGATAEEVQALLALQHSVYEASRRGAGYETVEKTLTDLVRESLEKMPEASRKDVSPRDSLIRARVAAQMAVAKSPWFKEFISFNPATALEKVTCPVLAIFGEVDQQVPPSLNRAPMEQAFSRAGNHSVRIRTLPKTNHLFLASETGDPGEYATMKKEFVRGFLEEMSSWLRSRYQP